MMQETLGNSRQQGDDITSLFIRTPSWKSLTVSSQVRYANMVVWKSFNDQMSLNKCQNNSIITRFPSYRLVLGETQLFFPYEQVKYESIFDNDVTFGISAISDIDFSLCYKCTWFWREIAHLLRRSEPF